MGTRRLNDLIGVLFQISPEVTNARVRCLIKQRSGEIATEEEEEVEEATCIRDSGTGGR